MSKSSEIFVLAPYVRIGIKEDVLHLGFGSLQKKIYDPLEKCIYIEATYLWLQPNTANGINLLLGEVFGGQECEKAINFAVHDLIKNKFVIRSHIYCKESVYSRSHLFYEMSGADSHNVQTNLSKKHVAILGVGGIGNLVAVSLATLGIGKLTLVDDDDVESSNLSRQFMYTLNDIGMKKTEVLKNAILARVDAIEVTTIPKFVSKDVLNLMPSGIDLMVLSADSYGVVEIVNGYSVKNSIPFINVGYILDVAVFGPFVIPGKTGCMKCQPYKCDNIYPEKFRDKIQCINDKFQPPSFAPINMMAVSYGLMDIIKFLGEFGSINSLDNRVGIWTNSLLVQRQNFNRNPECLECKFV